jgi:hypothetical protein
MPKTFDAGLFGQDYLDNSLKGFATFSKGLQAIAVETTEYTKKSFEAGSAALEKLYAAKSLESALEVQNAYAKSAYEAFVAQATKVSEMYADLAKDLYQPLETLVAKAK